MILAANALFRARTDGNISNLFSKKTWFEEPIESLHPNI